MKTDTKHTVHTKVAHPRLPLDAWMEHNMTRSSGLNAGPHSLLTAPLSRAAIEQWQMAMLRRTLRHAQTHSPFYKKKLADITAEAIQTPQDLVHIPFTTASDLQQTPESLLCLSQDAIARVVTLATSGSTGSPKRLFFTQEDLEQTIEFFRWGMHCLTEPGAHVLALLPAGRPDSVGRLLTDGLTRLGALTCVYAEADNIPGALETLLNVNASCIVGTPAHLFALAKTWRSAGLPLASVQQDTDSTNTCGKKACSLPHITAVLPCWDTAPPQLAAYLAQTWGCRVQHHWGMTETGLGGAVECTHMQGMHLREADIYVEIIHPETKRPVPDGDTGEIVVTTITRRGMPLIRYRTGDYARILNTPCACASPLRRLSLPARYNASCVHKAAGAQTTGSPASVSPVHPTEAPSDKKLSTASSDVQPESPPVSLAMLDTCLLGIEAILAYQAQWHADAQVLHIKLDLLPTLQQKASSSSSPQHAYEQNTLKQATLAVQEQTDNAVTITASINRADGTIATGFAKRRIHIVREGTTPECARTG